MGRGNLAEEALTGSIIGAFFAAYREIGFGFLEHICCNVLDRELIARGHKVAREVGVPVYYKGIQVGFQRLDMIVDGKVVIEVKSTPILHKDPARQLYNYLRATRLEIGLWLHFGKEPNFERVVCFNQQKEMF